MLVGDHLGIQQMTHLHLRHAQVRLPDNQVVKALDARAARRCNQGAVELDVVFDEFRHLAILRDGGAKTIDSSHRVRRHLSALGEKTDHRPLDEIT